MEARRFRQLIDAPPTFSRIVAEQAAKELQVVFDRQGRVEILAQTLRHVGNGGAYPAAVAS